MAVSPLAPQWLQFPENINALRQIEWASGVSREASGELSVQGIKVSALAEEFGTPLFVLDENDFRARARGFKTAFDQAFKELCGAVDVYYAGKAFVCTEVARWVTDEGRAWTPAPAANWRWPRPPAFPRRISRRTETTSPPRRSPGPSPWASGASSLIRSMNSNASSPWPAPWAAPQK